MESFDSTKTSLKEILKQVHEGKIQLPDFQRGWIWDDNRIKGLIASIIKSFPIGAIMLLETGNPDVKFKPNPIQGVKNPICKDPQYLVLDGQQRITSMYQTVVTNEIVTTRNDKNYEIKRWYYIDMEMALNPNIDLEEAIISVNENKQITQNIGRDIVLDLSTRENEYQRLMYPVCMLDEYRDWRRGYYEYWEHDSDRSRFWDKFEEKVISSYNSYMLPVIVMKKENTKEAVCQVFEKVNTGGVVLTVFELLTATYAAEEFDLKENWRTVQSELRKFKVLGKVQNTDFLQSITLLARFRRRQSVDGVEDNNQIPISCKRKDVLNLCLEEYQNCFEHIQSGYVKAAKLLAEQHIYTSYDLPYNTQLIPLAAILAVIGNQIENASNKKKLMQWFWCGVFGELYGSANETRYALDLPQVVDWIVAGGSEPKTILDSNFNHSRLLTLKTRNSAAYKGVYALLLGVSPRDWLSNTPIEISSYFSANIDIHHVFPVAWCRKNNIRPEQYDCIINKTPLSGSTNRFIGGEAPSKYIARLEQRIGLTAGEFQVVLESHKLELTYLRIDDFEGFMNHRKELLLQMIEAATGKTIPRDVDIREEGVFVEEEDGDSITDEGTA